jgi:5'-nucleotidase
MKESKFTWLAANVIDKKTGKPFGNAEAVAIREFDGVKVGIFGLVLPSTKFESRPGPDVEFLDPCETARNVVPQLHERGAKTVVALTHLSMSEDKKVAKCAQIDVIVGGHEHTLLQSAAGGAPIFKMTSDARELGKIDLNISKESGRVQSIDWRIIPVTKEIKDAPEFGSITNKYTRLLPQLARVVGTTRVPLDARSKENRTRETNVGNFITDAFRAATSSDVALINGGSIRADTIIDSGVLTRRDLLSLLPYSNKIVKLEVTGKTLREIIEHGLARTAEDSEPGRFPQVSGVRFSYDASRQPGSRIVDIKVNGQPLNDSRTYTLATTNFLSSGGDDYAMLKSQLVLIAPEQAQTDTTVLERVMRGRAIAAKVEGRILRLDRSQKALTDCN